MTKEHVITWFLMIILWTIVLWILLFIFIMIIEKLEKKQMNKWADQNYDFFIFICRYCDKYEKTKNFICIPKEKKIVVTFITNDNMGFRLEFRCDGFIYIYRDWKMLEIDKSHKQQLDTGWEFYHFKKWLEYNVEAVEEFNKFTEWLVPWETVFNYKNNNG